MNATNAHSLRDPPSNSMTVIPHMPRNSARAAPPFAKQDPSTPIHIASTAYNLHERTRPPASFVDGLLINGVRLRVPIAAEKLRQSRVIQQIARLGNATGGFRTFGAAPLLRARLQFNEIADVCSARKHVLLLRNQLIGFANTLTTTQTARGGSCKDIDAHVQQSDDGSTHLEVHLLIEVPDRSDVLVTDTMIAKMAPLIEQITHGRRRRTAISCIADRPAAMPAHASTCFAAEAARKVHSVEHAAAAVALAQSLAGLHAHATEAIMRSNPAQHAYDLALLAGARGSETKHVVEAMLTARALRFDHAITLLDGMRA